MTTIFDMSGTSDTRCGCGGGRPAVRIVRGNDFTVEASASVWDADKGIYVPFDLSGAEDVELNIVGLYSKVAGGDVSVSGNRVSAGFTGAVGAGVYGVEVIFRDSGGRGRVFERGLFEVVEDSGDATIGTGAEGGSGEGLNVSVDVRTRTVRIGQTVGVTDYGLLDNKPSIGGVELKGDRTAEELGLYSREEADGLLDGKADKSDIPTKTSELTNDSDYATNAKVDSSVEALAPYDCTWAWGLKQGDEAPEDKVDDLRKAIDDKRPLFTKYTNKNGYLLRLGVFAEVDDKDDTIIYLTSIGSSYTGRSSIGWVVIDDDTSADYVYSVVSRGARTLQDALVSGESIKTVNGESLLGGGDISVSLRQLTYDERVALYAVAEKVKAATDEMVAITEAQYNALAALPDAGLIGNILIAKRAEKEGDYTLYYLSGVSDVNEALYSDFMFASAAGEDGVTQYVAAPYLSGSVTKSVRLTANADGTLTADTTPSSLTKVNGLLSSFPVMVVWRKVSGQVSKPNNVRCCFAQDVQTMKNDSSYYDTIQTVFLSLNGVYYKWVDTTLTPVQSAVGQTPVVYTFAAGDDGTFGDVGMDDTGRFSIIDELEFKAANPTKSNLMVKVVSGGASCWLTNVSLADGVITCSGYIPQDKTTLALAITAEGKVSMTLTKDDTLVIDSKLSLTSENPVQNKVVSEVIMSFSGKINNLIGEINKKADAAHTHTKSDITDFPANVSAFSNDAGYQTAAQVQTMIDNAVTTALNTEV